jgi:hypothetical protein
MSSDRLKDISDYVDSVFIENEIVEKIIEDEVVKDILVEKVIEKKIESKFVKLMNDIEKSLYFRYKYNGKPENMEFRTIYMIFIYALYKKGGYSLELKKLAEYNILYFENIDEYMLDTYGKEQRRCIKNIFKKFNIEPIYENYEGNIIKHKIDNIDKIINILDKNPNKIYPIEKFINYKKLLNKFREYIVSLGNNLIMYINNLDSDIITFFDNGKTLSELHSIHFLQPKTVSIDIKDYKLHVISVCMNKINRIFRCVNRFNIPELKIYNKLIELKKFNPNIICILNNYNLPITRNGMNELVADFLVITKCYNNLRFSLIEYDGPSHYDKSYHRFNKEGILCDIVKNNFCRLNGIDIIRVRDKDINYLERIVDFMNNVCMNDDVVICVPGYEEYMSIIDL